MRPLALAVVLALAAGCVRWTTGEETPLASSSQDLPGAARGTIVLAAGLRLVEARVGVAPERAEARGTAEAPHALGSDSGAQTALERDHWVLRVHLAEARPGAVAGVVQASLEWNGAPRGDLWVQGGEGNRLLREILLTYDLGPELADSNVYVLTLHATPGRPTNR